MPYCSICGTANREGSTYCNGCGTKLSGKERICEACGTRNTPSSKFCHLCGAVLPVEQEGKSETASFTPVNIQPGEFPDENSLAEELPSMEAEIPADLLIADLPAIVEKIEATPVIEGAPTNLTTEAPTIESPGFDNSSLPGPDMPEAGLPTGLETPPDGTIIASPVMESPTETAPAFAVPEWLDLQDEQEIATDTALARTISEEKIGIPATSEILPDWLDIADDQPTTVAESFVNPSEPKTERPVTEEITTKETLPDWLDLPDSIESAMPAEPEFTSPIVSQATTDVPVEVDLPQWLDVEEGDFPPVVAEVESNEGNLVERDVSAIPDWLLAEKSPDTSPKYSAVPLESPNEEESILLEHPDQSATRTDEPMEQNTLRELLRADQEAESDAEDAREALQTLENPSLPEWLALAEKQEGVSDLEAALKLPVPVFDGAEESGVQSPVGPEELEGVSPFGVEEISGNVENLPALRNEDRLEVIQPGENITDFGEEGPGLTQGIALSKTFQPRGHRDNQNAIDANAPGIENAFSDSGSTETTASEKKKGGINAPRIIALILLISVTLPFFLPLGLAVEASANTVSAYQTINQVPANSTVVVSFDWDGSTNDEMAPIATALLDHLASRQVKVIAVSLVPEGGQLAQQILARLESRGYKYGTQYVNLGYMAGEKAGIQSMVKGFSFAYKEDQFGTKLDSIPLVKQVLSVKDASLFIALAGNPDRMQDWVTQLTATSPSTRIVGGITALGGPIAQPFIQSKQLLGLVSGVPGAAEYELHGGTPKLAAATLDAQSLAHLSLVLMIVGANVSLLVRRGK